MDRRWLAAGIGAAALAASAWLWLEREPAYTWLAPAAGLEPGSGSSSTAEAPSELAGSEAQPDLGEMPALTRTLKAPTDPSELCDEELWSNMKPLIEQTGDGEVFVHEAEWNTRITSARVGIASWMSKCLQEGGPIEIRAAGSGLLLAIYDSTNGYRPGGPPR